MFNRFHWFVSVIRLSFCSSVLCEIRASVCLLLSAPLVRHTTCWLSSVQPVRVTAVVGQYVSLTVCWSVTVSQQLYACCIGSTTRSRDVYSSTAKTFVMLILTVCDKLLASYHKLVSSLIWSFLCVNTLLDSLSCSLHDVLGKLTCFTFSAVFSIVYNHN